METFVLIGLWASLCVQFFGVFIYISERKPIYATVEAMFAATALGAISLINGWV